MTRLLQRIRRQAYQLGFDTGAQWGYRTGRMDEKANRPLYAGIANVVHLHVPEEEQ